MESAEGLRDSEQVFPTADPSDTDTRPLRREEGGGAGEEGCKPGEKETEQQDVNTGLEILPAHTLSTRRKAIDTANSLTINFCMGVNYALLGLTLIDLERQLSANTEAVSALFTCRGVGIFVSCLFSGPLFDHVNHGLLFVASLLLIGVGHLVTPFIPWIGTVSAVFGLQAVGVGIINIGALFLLTRHWQKRAGSFIHALQFTYDIAAFLSPLVQKLFISSVLVESMHYNLTRLANNLTTSAEPSVYFFKSDAYEHQPFNSSQYHDYQTDDVLQNNVAVIEQNWTSVTVTYETDLVGLNALIGGFVLLLAFLDLLMAISFGTVSSVWQTSAKEPKSIGKPMRQLKRKPTGCFLSFDCRRCSHCDWRRHTRVLLLATLLTFMYGTEGIAVVLSVVYHVKGLGWTLQDAVTVASVRALMCGGSRFLMIFISRLVTGRTQVLANCAMCTFIMATMTGCVVFSPGGVWVLLLLNGVPLATLFGASLTWASEQVAMTSFVSAVFTLPYALGLVVGPSVASYFFEVHGPHWYVYLMFSYILMSDGLVIVILAFNYLSPIDNLAAHSNNNKETRCEKNLNTGIHTSKWSI